MCALNGWVWTSICFKLQNKHKSLIIHNQRHGYQLPSLKKCAMRQSTSCQLWCQGDASYTQEQEGRRYSQRTETEHTLQCVGLVGTSGPVVPLPLLPPDICLPLHLSLASPLDANTKQHFMRPGAVKWPPWGNLTRHELSRPASRCLLIRRRCAGVLVAGLSIPTPFPTSHASSPLPEATAIARCGGWETCIPPLRPGELDALLGKFWGGGMEWDWTRGQGFSTFLGNK